LYKKAGVSPLGGCLPMVIQMPFLITMFQFFPNSIELRQQSFLWAFDLSTYDSIWNFGKLPLIDSIYGDHVSLFTLLMTVSTLIYTLLNNQMTGVSGQMKYIGYIMPIFFLGFFNNYASGLTYYYFLTNVISIGQQFIMRRFVDEDALHRKIQENKKKPVKKSAFQQRLEDMAKKRGVGGAAPKKK
jgi:YidC/Oxa1 family membrane protein insertase